MIARSNVGKQYGPQILFVGSSFQLDPGAGRSVLDEVIGGIGQLGKLRHELVAFRPRLRSFVGSRGLDEPPRSF